ncbi:MAG TPA: hypothetical protein VNA69_22705 [Thermoanaerobaculia bacterium]|nr:hypothetical protein [Thermoanaerobaculia bacterium]
MKRRLVLSVVLLVASLSPLSTTLAQEHPEHPKKAEKAGEVNTTDLENAIKAEIAEKSKETDGVFKLNDPEPKKTWDLTLDRVHKDRLSKLSADTYFACVDMKDASGTTIDVDFFLKSKDGKLEMTDTTVHKVDGKPRYNWKEENGIWKRVPLSE